MEEIKGLTLISMFSGVKERPDREAKENSSIELYFI
jgi:hypothetical protein